MKPSSKKNIRPVLADINHPRGAAPHTTPVHPKTEFFKRQKETSFVIKIGWLKYLKKSVLVVILVLIITAAGFSWYLWNFKNEALASASLIYENLKSAASGLANLENDEADVSISTAQGELAKLQNKASLFSLFPILKEIPATILEIRDLTARLKNINENVDVLKVEGFKMLFGGGGNEFVNILKNLRADIIAIDNSVTDLRNKASMFNVLPAEASEDYLVLNLNTDRVIAGLGAVIDLLEKPGATHFVVLFENPSEMRPAGGFTGSYADLVLEDGGVKTIDVDDIYRPDKFLDLKIIPPKQLQGMTPDWGVRDANWFFNFPDSAEKTIELLQASSVYEDEGVTFDGVIAMNVRVIEDILKIIGPIEIPEYKLTLDDKNFLQEVQWEVEAGRDKKPGENPKKVLEFILPKILEGLNNLGDGRRELLMDALSYRLANKDIKFYFEDKRLQNIVSESGVGGEVYLVPDTWNGDYLAVVNANVAGGKTDAFMTQNIELMSKIDGNGLVNNNLTITRSHGGQNEKESWYKQTNQNFIKIFTPWGSKLLALTGNTPKTIKPLVSNYEKKGYVVDEDLKILENTEEFMKEFNAYSYKESGKSVFGTWFNIPAGQTKELSLTYVGQKKIDLRPGSRFQFIFDKQSGVESRFEYILEAPNGFKWLESDDFIYHYKSDTLPSRLVINLTLEKM